MSLEDRNLFALGRLTCAFSIPILLRTQKRKHETADTDNLCARFTPAQCRLVHSICHRCTNAFAFGSSRATKQSFHLSRLRSVVKRHHGWKRSQSCMNSEKKISAKCGKRQIEENGKIRDEGKNEDSRIQHDSGTWERSMERQSAPNAAKAKMLQKSWT